MATPTYDLLASSVLTSSASSVTFDNLDTVAAGYRDLILVLEGTNTGGAERTVRGQFNSDTGSNYSRVTMIGDGSSPISASSTSDHFVAGSLPASGAKMTIVQILDFSATDKHKPLLSRLSGGGFVAADAMRWANTAAITSIYLFPTADSFASGSTFYLYGISA